jgi:hypothetical protein
LKRKHQCERGNEENADDERQRQTPARDLNAPLKNQVTCDHGSAAKTIKAQGHGSKTPCP